MTRDARRWFRVELSKEGEIVSCMQVDHASKDVGLVFYVLRLNGEAAQRAAFDAYHRLQQQRRRDKLQTLGLCRWCGNKADRGPGLRCSSCHENHSAESARASQRAKGVDVPKLTRPSNLGLRYQILLEVRQALEDANSRDAFRRWIDREILMAKRRLPDGKKRGAAA